MEAIIGGNVREAMLGRHCQGGNAREIMLGIVCFVYYCVSFYIFLIIFFCLDRIENQQVVEYVIQVK